jgi:hypothetical protein
MESGVTLVAASNWPHLAGHHIDCAGEFNAWVFSKSRGMGLSHAACAQDKQAHFAG